MNSLSHSRKIIVATLHFAYMKVNHKFFGD